MSPIPYFGVRSYATKAEAVAHADAAARHYSGVWRVFKVGERCYRVLAAWGNPHPSWACVHRAEFWPIDAAPCPF